jgi:transposase
MANGQSEEFKRDAVRIALTSGLTRRQVASDLGIGVSTLNKWIKVAQNNEDASLPDVDLVREVERLRKENAVLKQEREILKKATAFFASQKQ